MPKGVFMCVPVQACTTLDKTNWYHLLQNGERWQQQPLPLEQFLVEYVQFHWRLMTMDCRKESLILQIHTYKQLSLKFDINVYHATAHTYFLTV